MKNLVLLSLLLIASCTSEEQIHDADILAFSKKTPEEMGAFADSMDAVKLSKGLPIIHIQDIAGKSENHVSKVLGKPTSKETVNPSRTPCPCIKNIYNNGEVEIVFINKKADWITINNPAYFDTGNESDYVSMQKFDNYVYVKVITK